MMQVWYPSKQQKQQQQEECKPCHATSEERYEVATYMLPVYVLNETKEKNRADKAEGRQ